MSDFETSPPKEIEIDADGEGGEALLKKSPSPETEPAKTNGKSGSDHRRNSRSRSRSGSHSRSRHKHHRSRRRHSRSRSRSRSPRHRRRRSRHSRSRSRGRRDSDYDRHRSSYSRRDSRSPMSSRKRHTGDRDNPEPNRCIGVFGLSLYTQERGLREVFGRYGPIEDVQVVYDRQTGRSRGFAFVYFRSADDAFEAKDRCNGIDIDGRPIRVDFSITERAHTPTPGIYLGKPSGSPSRSPGRRQYTSSFRRSPSPYGYSYRRSRSFSPPR